MRYPPQPPPPRPICYEFAMDIAKYATPGQYDKNSVLLGRESPYFLFVIKAILWVLYEYIVREADLRVKFLRFLRI